LQLTKNQNYVFCAVFAFLGFNMCVVYEHFLNREHISAKQNMPFL